MPESFVVNAVLPSYATLLITVGKTVASNTGRYVRCIFFPSSTFHYILLTEQLENQLLSS